MMATIDQNLPLVKACVRGMAGCVGSIWMRRDEPVWEGPVVANEGRVESATQLRPTQRA